jgi:hypothetical protein
MLLYVQHRVRFPQQRSLTRTFKLVGARDVRGCPAESALQTVCGSRCTRGARREAPNSATREPWPASAVAGPAGGPSLRSESVLLD